MHQGFWSVSDLIHWVDLRGNLQETMVVLKPSLCIAILTLPWVPSGVPIYDTWFLLRSKVPSPSTPGTNCRSLFPCPVMLDDTSAEAWLVTYLEKLGIYIYIGFWWFLPGKTSEKAYKHYWNNQKNHQLCIFFASSTCIFIGYIGISLSPTFAGEIPLLWDSAKPT